jgi:biopolymer transport protein ExbD
MSHGPTAEGSSAEPNLTPLLDVVLQLIMFFMMCVNFVTEQVNEDIKLPASQAARPMEKTENEVLFLNVKPFAARDFQDKVSQDALGRLQEKFAEGDPCVLIVGKDPMKPIEFKFWLRQQYEDAEKTSKDGKVNTAIIIRAHRDADYANVFELLQICKVQGYKKLKLRAITRNTGVTS